MELVELRKKDSPHDIMFKGKQLKLKIGCCEDGLVIQYLMEVDPPKNPLSQMMMGGDGGKITVVALQQHVHLRWWEKVLGVSLENKARKTIKSLKVEVARIALMESLAEKLTEELG